MKQHRERDISRLNRLILSVLVAAALGAVDRRSTAQVVCVADGGAHSIAVESNGSLWTWGYNSEGQLGNGGFANTSVPALLATVPPILRAFAGGTHSMALDSQGNLWGWGRNGNGQLGTGSFAPITVSNPVMANGISGVVEVAAGSNHNLALLGDGTVWSWGFNGAGQLGNGTTTSSCVPTQVPALSNVIAIAAGDDLSLAVGDDGTVWAWGSNSFGQLGRGLLPSSGGPPYSSIPAQVIQVTGATAIACGNTHAMALLASGTVVSWGSNVWGEAGTLTYGPTATPVLAAPYTDVVDVSCRSTQSFIIRGGGVAFGCGRNDLGQLGNGTNNVGFGWSSVASPSAFLKISIGGAHAHALTTNGQIFAWGNNYYGELGVGTPPSSTSTPLPISLTQSLTTCASGNVGLGFGGPFNILSVNGSAGLPARRVDIGIGSPITIAVAQPPTNPFAASFAIIGYSGVPHHSESWALPFGIGTLCFPAPQLFPSYPGLFTLTNNFGPEPGQLVGSNPAPWSFTAAGLPFAFQFTLQGVIQQDPGTVRVMNGVIVNVQ